MPPHFNVKIPPKSEHGIHVTYMFSHFTCACLPLQIYIAFFLQICRIFVTPLCHRDPVRHKTQPAPSLFEERASSVRARDYVFQVCQRISPTKPSFLLFSHVDFFGQQNQPASTTITLFFFMLLLFFLSHFGLTFFSSLFFSLHICFLMLFFILFIFFISEVYLKANPRCDFPYTKFT